MAQTFRDLVEERGYGRGAATAGPTGLGQVPQETEGQSGFRDLAAQRGYDGSVDMSATYRQWYTGANQEGVDNGWDTDFVRAHVAQGDEALASGDMWNRYAREDATGVVLWDGAKDSRGNALAWGDVMSNGQKVGNVYEDLDRHTANVMMGQFTIQDGARKARLNADSDHERAWDDEMQRLRQEFSQQAEVAPKAEQLAEDTEERAEGENVWAVTAAGAGGGALFGAGVGSVVPVIGTAIGTVAGTVAGGLAAWLNQDQLKYGIARSREVVELAAESGGRDAQVSQAVQQIAQNTYSVAMSPLQNLWKGSYDVTTGLARGEQVFDASTGGNFYATNDEGERLAPGWVQALDLAAMLGDSLIQFSSPLGMHTYQAQMAVQIGGKASGLLPGVGQFDQSRLEMNSVWYNDKGEFDLGNALAGVGSVGIDVVQLGGVTGLLRSTDQFANRVLGRTGLDQATAGTRVAQSGNRFLRSAKADEATWLQRRNLTADQRTALKNGGELEVRSGYKFVFDKDGNLVDGGRATMAMLAPSEALQSMSAAMRMRRRTARENGGLQAEELYRAANDMALGARPIQSMLVNGFGEGTEELLQSALDPLSMNAAIDGEEMMRAAAGGFAAGLGMGGAAVLRAPRAEVAMYHQAKLAHFLTTRGDTLRWDQWKAMGQVQRRKLVRSLTDMDRSLINGAVDKIQHDLTDTVNGGVVAAQWARDEQAKQIAAALDNGTIATDATHTIVELDEATVRPDAVVTSHTQLSLDQKNRTKGIQAQIDNIGQELREIGKALKANPADSVRKERQTELTATQDQLKEILWYSKLVQETIDYHVRRIDSAIDMGSSTLMETEVDELNQVLAEYFEMPGTQVQVRNADGSTGFTDLTPEARFNLMRAVSRIVTRHPQDSTGSVHVFVPQVDRVFAQRRTRGTAAISQISLKSLRGDYDGDKVQELNQLLLDDEDYISMRAGANLLGTGFAPEIGTTKAEEWILDEISRARVSEHDGIRALPETLKTNLANDLRARYQTPGNATLGIPARDWIPSATLERVIERVNDVIDSGGDVRQTLLTEMSTEAGTYLQKLGRTGFNDTRFSNEYFALARLATKHLQEFQRHYAASVPRQTTEPSTVSVLPTQFSTATQEQRAIAAANKAAQMAMQLPGDNLFRMFQKLHYTLFYSTEVGVGWSNDNVQFQELVEAYETLSSATTDLKINLMPANDDIVGAVLDQLLLLSHDPNSMKRLGLDLTATNNMALLANMEVAHWEYRPDDSGAMRQYFTGRTVTLAQQLLYQELEKYRASKVSTWTTDPDVQAPYWALIEMTEPSRQGLEGGAGNAERTFVEVFNAVRLYDVLGPEAAVMLNANMTVGQYFRRLKNLPPAQRSDEKHALYAVGEYLSSEDLQIPYSHSAVEGKRVTLFRSVVDSLWSAANSELSVQASGADKGKTTGRMAIRDRRYSDDFKAAYDGVRKVLQAYRPAYSWTAQDIADLVEEHPSYGRALLDAVPDHLREMVLKGRTQDGYKLASWFFNVFTKDTVEQAEMEMLRQIVTQGWFSKLHHLGLDESTGDTDVHKRMAYHAMTHRMHRVMFRLAAQSHGDIEAGIDPNALPYQLFMQELENATSAEAFVKWLNSHPELTGETAPFLVWINDTAEFDEDKSGSGWSKQMTMPAVRDSLKVLAQASDSFVKNLERDEKRRVADTKFAEAVERWEKRNEPNAPAPKPGDREHHQNLQAALDNAQKYQMTYGPRAMITQVLIATFGMYGQAHTKGNNPEFLAAVETAEALLNAFGYTINAERLLADLTSHDESAVAATPELMLKDAGRYVDKFGSEVEWAPPSISSILPYLKTEKHRHLLRSMLFPQVMELDADGKARRKMLLGGKMEDLVQSTTYAQLYDDSGAAELAKAMRWLSVVEGMITEESGGTEVFAVQQRVAQLVIARSTAATKPRSFDEQWNEVIDAYMTVYREMTAVSRTQATPGQADPVHEAYRAFKKNQRIQALAQAYDLDASEIADDLNGVVSTIELALAEEFSGEIQELNQQLVSYTDPAVVNAMDPVDLVREINEATVLRDSLQAEWDEKKARLKALASMDVQADMVARYGYSAEWDAATKNGRRQVLLDYVKRHMNLSRGYPEIQPVVTEILNWWKNGPQDRVAHPFVTSEETWELLSSAIISFELYDLLETGSIENTPPVFPPTLTQEERAAHKLDKQKFFDHGHMNLLDYMSPDTTSVMLPVLRRMAVKAGKAHGEVGQAAVLDTIKQTTMREGTLGAWSGVVPIHNIEASELLTGASAKPAVSQAGKLSERWSAPIFATRRDYTRVAADSSAVLEWKHLTGDIHQEVDVTIRGVTRRRPVAQLNKRFASKVEVTFNDGTADVPVQVFGDELATRTWVGEYSNAAARGSNLLEVRLNLLPTVIERALAQHMPNATPAQLAAARDSVKVSMEFVHPDAQAAGERFNNLWREGTNFESDGDTLRSVLEGLFFGVGGLNATVQQAALDTRKKGLLGIERYVRPKFSEVKQIEEEAYTDLGRVLTEKTRIFMQTAIGGGKTIDPSYYNGVHKLMKLKHWIEGVDRTTGERVRLPAEAVIDWQLSNPNVDIRDDAAGFPLRDVKLWIPSNEVLSTMLGEIGFGGVRGRAFQTEVKTDPNTIPSYQGWSDQMQRLFDPTKSQPKSVTDTDVARQSHMNDVRVNFRPSDALRDEYTRRRDRVNRVRAQGLTQRQIDPKLAAVDWGKSRRNVKKAAREAIKTMDLRLTLPQRLGWAEAKATRIGRELGSLIDTYISEQKSNYGKNVGAWFYQHNSTKADPTQGFLDKASLDNLPRVPGDLFIIDVAGFTGTEDEIEQATNDLLAKLNDEQVSVVFVSSQSKNRLTSEMQRDLLSKYRYQQYEGSPLILVPDTLNEPLFQNEAASQSHLTSFDALTIANQRITMLLLDREVEENTIYVPDGPSRFDAMQVSIDLLPTDAANKFGVPKTREDLEAVRTTLTGLSGDVRKRMMIERAQDHLWTTDKDGKRVLKQGKTNDDLQEIADDFIRSWDRLMARIDKAMAQNTTLPVYDDTFGTGDFIPLLGPNKELLFYRHGHELPNEQEIRRQLAGEYEGQSEFRGVVLYSGQRVPNATIHEGRVIQTHDSQNYGLRLEMELDVEALGSKFQFEYNGMKYIRGPLPPGMELPDVPAIGNQKLDGVASLHDVLSKQAFRGLGNNFGTWFTAVGFDTRPYLRKFFDGLEDAQIIDLLEAVQNDTASTLQVDEVTEIQGFLVGQGASVNLMTSLIPTFQRAGLLEQWGDMLADTSPEAYLTRSLLLYLMTPGSNLNAVLSTTGFNVDRPGAPGAKSQRMPELFTRMFDLAPMGTPIRKELEKHINDRIGSKVVNGKRVGFELDADTWEVTARGDDGRVLMRGMWQFGEAHVDDSNPTLNAQAQDRKTHQGVSVHAQLMGRAVSGGVTQPQRKKLKRIEDTLESGVRVPTDVGQVWGELTRVDTSTMGPGAAWQMMNAAEHVYEDLSLEHQHAYRRKISMTGGLWDEEHNRRTQEEISDAINDIVTYIGLHPSQAEIVHYWIRQVLWAPSARRGQKDFKDELNPQDVLGATQHILKNLRRGQVPTKDGAGPSMLAKADLDLLFNTARRNKASGTRSWTPWAKTDDPSSALDPTDYGQWIATTWAQVINSDAEFDPAITIDFDGFLNTYRAVLRETGFLLDVTVDKELQTKLVDPTTNALITTTISPVERVKQLETVILPGTGLGINDIENGVLTAESGGGTIQPASWENHRQKARARWRAKNKIQPVKAETIHDYMEEGANLLNRNADLNSLERILMALRHGNAMLNPGLYVTMLPEQGFRSILAQATNFLTGSATSRGLGGITARGFGEVDELTGRKKYTLNQYTPEQIRALNNLYRQLGDDKAFSGTIIRELMYVPGGAKEGNAAVRFFEKFAALGNKWQDPTWGTPQRALARRYVEGILRAIQAMPIDTAMTTDAVIAYLRSDPAYFAKHHEELHRIASNHVVDYRAMKNTVFSLGIKKLYEPLLYSSSGGFRFIGTLTKLPLMYANFSFNTLTTMAGLQGYNQMLAVFLDGRKKPGLMQRWEAAFKGAPLTEDESKFNMESAMDGVDIANAFIKGGVTQTGLFFMGLMGHSFLGLSGEDEEARRRRKLAEAQNAPPVVDPRRLEADFRNKDTLFLDWFPEPLQAFFRVTGEEAGQDPRSMVQFSWILKPFLNPIIGFERFFQTGDFGWVTHAFYDALVSLPLFNLNTWDDAVRSAAELEELAAEAEMDGGPTATKDSMWFLLNAVGVYERMLVENMWVNTLYTGYDEYERDSARMPLRDSDGDIQRTIENLPRANDVGLRSYVNDEGEVQQAYLRRSPYDAYAAAVAKKNATAALFLSLVTGNNNAYWRRDQPVKTVKIEAPELSRIEGAALVAAAIEGANKDFDSERQLSLQEITTLLGSKYAQAGNWDAYNNVDAEALQIYESSENPEWNPMYFVSNDGTKEEPGREAVLAAIAGLRGGTITLDSPVIQQLGLSAELRDELETEFIADEMQRGVDMGMTNSQANKRVQRLLFGPLDNPQVKGFREILRDKRIPLTGSQTYKQLNTTYATGPDGYPWATGFQRGSRFASSLIGGALKRPNIPDAVDNMMNTQNFAAQQNTGLRGLVPMDRSELIPTDLEQTEMIIDALREKGLNQNSFTPFENNKKGGRGYFYRRPYYRRGYSRSGYGGSGGYAQKLYWSRQPQMPRGTNIYLNGPRALFWDNASVRRYTIRRERYSSQRGRLKEWQ